MLALPLGEQEEQEAVDIVMFGRCSRSTMAIKKVALVKAGVVDNIIQYDTDATWDVPAGYTTVDATSAAEVGGTYSGGSFGAANKPPQTTKETLINTLCGGTDLTLAEVNSLLREMV